MTLRKAVLTLAMAGSLSATPALIPESQPIGNEPGLGKLCYAVAGSRCVVSVEDLVNGGDQDFNDAQYLIAFSDRYDGSYISGRATYTGGNAANVNTLFLPSGVVISPRVGETEAFRAVALESLPMLLWSHGDTNEIWREGDGSLNRDGLPKFIVEQTYAPVPEPTGTALTGLAMMAAVVLWNRRTR
jgi:hypothetical protein